MKRLFFLLILTISAISSFAEDKLVEKPRFFDNWSVTLSGGAYHPMIYDLKYLLDCSQMAGAVELKKQISPIFGLGIEANGYYKMSREERKDPRTVIGPVVHINLMNLFGGYKGKPRFFELEAGVMPGWGHLYRGVKHIFFPDENFFVTKFGLDMNFNLGKSRAWTVALKPAIVYDMAVPHGNQYESYDINYADLQLMLGVTYHFHNHNGKRHFNYGVMKTDMDEVNRLNEIVNFLRKDVEQRDAEISTLKTRNESLTEENERLQKEIEEETGQKTGLIRETQNESK